MIRKILIPLLVIVLLASCNLAQKNDLAISTTPARSQVAPTETETAVVPVQGIAYESLDYCFEYPQDFTQLINGDQVEVVGPQSASNHDPGLVWIDAVDAQGRSALDIATEEVNAFGGSPERSIVMLGGEEALVLDGMPGQDAIRKAYIVHNGLLYTLNFSPFQSGNDTADAQMETLFEFVTSSWVWISSGGPCPGAD